MSKTPKTIVVQAEEQIYAEQRTVDYDTREFTVEIIVKKYTERLDEDDNEIFVPDYQREFVWDEERQSKFIESVILDLPLPLIFVAENKSGRLEIVDGSQRIRTLHAFLNNELRLEGLSKLDKLNGFTFEKLEQSRQRKINNTALRMIILSENANEDVKNDMFERINRGSDLLKEMEKRKGIYRGCFTDFIYNECAHIQKFKNLAPMNKWIAKRQEHEELILRFFALTDLYPKYPTKHLGIAKALDKYLEEKNTDFNALEKKQKLQEFIAVINFVENYFEHGFAKTQTPQVSRIYFEAISVGVYLALKQNPNLETTKDQVNSWLKTKEFNEIISGKYQTHIPSKICQRIEFVRDKLLGVS